MILDELSFWKGSVEVNGEKFDSIEQAQKSLAKTDGSLSSVVLHSVNKSALERNYLRSNSTQSTLYKITVKQYMTKPASPEFDFMSQWNNNIPMPLRTMVGIVEKETKGMIYMKLHGDIMETKTQCCMKCGRPITNPISQFFGMGPECGNHNYVNPFESDEELQMVIDNYRRNYLQRITWEGWIIKSAIISKEEINNG